MLYDLEEGHDDSPQSSLHFFKDRSKISKLRTTVYGGYLKDSGSADKLRLLKPFLEVANENELIVVADAREVTLNVPSHEEAASAAVDSFLANFHKLTEKHPNAVVVSAEERCCSEAMSHSRPGDFFDAITKERKHRACSSGNDDCLWRDDENAEVWKETMHEKTLDDTFSSGLEEYNNMYLNSGILVGYPKDLKELLKVSDIDAIEDDQAVLTDLMLAAPEMIQLDYRQELFGTKSVQKGLKDGCLFEIEGFGEPLLHTPQMTRPLILHTPGKFYDCLDSLIDAMGGTSQQRYLMDYGEGEEGVERRLTAFKEERKRRDLMGDDGYNNYGVYGFYNNYGGYGIYAPWGFYSPYGFFQQFIFGPYGIFGEQNPYGYFGYGNYGNYGQYGVVNLLTAIFGNRIVGRSVNLGQFGYFFGIDNYGNYGQYGNYGLTGGSWYYSQYGNYGPYSSNYGTASSNLSGRSISPGLRIPTRADDTSTGYEWVNDMHQQIEVSIGGGEDEDENDDATWTSTYTSTSTYAPTWTSTGDGGYSGWYHNVFTNFWPWAGGGHQHDHTYYPTTWSPTESPTDEDEE